MQKNKHFFLRHTPNQKNIPTVPAPKSSSCHPALYLMLLFTTFELCSEVTHLRSVVEVFTLNVWFSLVLCTDMVESNMR